ncbi:MAG: hypothetical protein ABS87_15270 [Sphingomonas sp. SCN 67-18]|nr:MAG: hypothetical protein ABS87_15270 [Sphingomonas sp. SCN 67-18]
MEFNMTLLGHWTRQIAFSSVAAMALAAGTAAQANSHDDSFTIAVLGSVANSDTVSKIGLMYCQGQLR